MAITTSPNGLVFITGATGHVGFRTLIQALRSGLNVRAAVRSEAKAQLLLKRLLLKVPQLGPHKTPIFFDPESPAQARSPHRLTFCLIPDITASNAYDNAMDAVTHVIHIASPLVTGAQKPPIDTRLAEDYFINPAVQGTTSLLEAADRCGTVRRVVITSSIVALVPVAQMEGTEARPADQPVRATDRVPFATGPYHSEFAAYANSKMAALEAAERWNAAVRPAFDIVHLHPSFVLGRNDMSTSAGECIRGTNAMVLAMLLGKGFGPFAGATVHVDDVARCHVSALDARSVPGNANYILSQGSRWNDAKDIAARLFPEAVARRLLVDTGNVDTTAISIDVEQAQQTLGVRFKGFESQVKSLVSQFLELKAARKQDVSRMRPAVARSSHAQVVSA